MGTKLIQLLDSAWLEWLAARDRVPRDRVAEPGVCGHWSVKDLVGHIPLWDAEVLTDIQRWQLGLPYLTNDWQQMNDDDHAAKLDRPYDLLRVEMYGAHAVTRQAISELPDDLESEDLYRVAVDTWDHYPEHTQELTSWLTSSTSKTVSD